LHRTADAPIRLKRGAVEKWSKEDLVDELLDMDEALHREIEYQGELLREWVPEVTDELKTAILSAPAEVSRLLDRFKSDLDAEL